VVLALTRRRSGGGGTVSPTPEIRYTRSGDVALAYQVTGDGPLDLVFVPGWISNIELAWELPEFARFLGRLADFARLIWFDKRGTGLSDRVAGPVTLEARSDDIRAVMDAARSERAALVGWYEGEPSRPASPPPTPTGSRHWSSGRSPRGRPATRASRGASILP
jgi:hypothetical protein